MNMRTDLDSSRTRSRSVEDGTRRINTETNGGAVGVTRQDGVRPQSTDDFGRGGDDNRLNTNTTVSTNTSRILEGQLGGANSPSNGGVQPVSWDPTATANAPRAVVGKLEGFDATKLANPEHNTPKYQMARIFQHYPNTPEGLRQAMPEIQKLFPEARIVGSKGDKIDFGSHVDPGSGQPLGVVDVIRAAGAGGAAWQWQPDGASAGGAGVNGRIPNGGFDHLSALGPKWADPVDRNPLSEMTDEQSYDMLAQYLQRFAPRANTRVSAGARA